MGAIKIASVRSSKAKAWLKGRRNVFSDLELKFQAVPQTIWIHCSSAGEFEQAKPIMKALKQNFAQYQLLVSFFSPSGYNTGKNYEYADFTCFLPVDTKQNAARFIKILQPKLVIFVKYDFWYHYLSETASERIPLLLVSAVFRKNQVFFKSYGGFYRKILSFFTQIFVQDRPSQQLLVSYNYNNITLSGDTRFDRVKEIFETHSDIQGLLSFISGSDLIVAGSTWAEDEEALFEATRDMNVKLIIAPHEITIARLKQIKSCFKESINYSDLDQNEIGCRVLILDNVGMLATIYKYATISYVGGGFTKDGIHNILEASVYGKPVIFGPNHKKYREAGELMAAGGAFSFKNRVELGNAIRELLKNKTLYLEACKASAIYTRNNTGATKKVIDYIQANRLLTS